MVYAGSKAAIAARLAQPTIAEVLQHESDTKCDAKQMIERRGELSSVSEACVCFSLQAGCELWGDGC